jgi:nucleoid-associated protein YgaU
LARLKTKKSKSKTTKAATSVTITRQEQTAPSDFFQRITKDLKENRSYTNLIIGGLILIVVAALLINYFKKQADNIMTGQQTVNTQQPNPNASQKPLVSDKQTYTVKDGDTLFMIAQSLYNDGYKYPEIAKANNISDENTIQTGQVLNIPKIGDTTSKSADKVNDQEKPGTGGAINQTIWGERITSDTYTVQQGDWLSTISGRAYGDIYAFNKIVQANNISDPNNIEPGTVLKIPK